jgi:tetratricopeptide (TPR) repeat protein
LAASANGDAPGWYEMGLWPKALWPAECSFQLFKNDIEWRPIKRMKPKQLKILSIFMGWPCGVAVTLTVLALFLSCCIATAQQSGSAQDQSVEMALKSFAAQKEAQARALASSANFELPSEFGPFFTAIQNNDWDSASNDYFEMKYLINEAASFHRSWWQPVVETFGAEDQFRNGNEKYFTACANAIIQSIPPGGVYFGGTDSARFIITAMQKSQINGDPFFTLTQNSLADSTYLDYLRSMYGEKIYIPTADDSQKCFDAYYADVQERMRHNQLQPGETVTVNPNTGKMQVSGQVAVMGVNALIVKTVINHTPDREFYIEESFPLAWMYPYLEPHGLIFKLNREPLAELSDDIVQRDHDYWAKTVSPLIGDWVNNETSVKDISEFAEKVFHQHDFSGFSGDPDFVQNAYSCRMFAKERCSDGGLYAWRAQNAADAVERQRMHNEADFAFRQSLALCPYQPEVAYRYVQFLLQTNRTDDALIVARTWLSLDPYNRQASDLVRNLVQFANRPQTASQWDAVEKTVRANPSDYTNIFLLAAHYLEIQQTNRASELLQQTVYRPVVPAVVLRSAAQFFAGINDFADLKVTLKKLTLATPGVPETWYDLARLDMRLGEYDEAMKALGIAVDYSDIRLQGNPRALNIRAAAGAEAAFNPIRDRADFQKLVSP